MESKSITTNWRAKFDVVMQDHLKVIRNAIECEKRSLNSRVRSRIEYNTLNVLLETTQGMDRGNTLQFFAKSWNDYEKIMNNTSINEATRYSSEVSFIAIEHVIMHRILRTDVLDRLYEHLSNPSN
jgi:hypothetical protein